jgi:hypothetical protein
LLTIVIAIISVLFYTYSKFTSSTKADVVNSVVGEFKAYDLLITAYIDDEEVYNFPSKDDGYILNEEKSYCDNATLEWDSENFKYTLSDTTKRTKCYLYFETKPPILGEYVTSLLSTSSGVVEDETDDKNIRYVGENPNNFIWFNCYDYNDTSTCERWRIIGLMNNVSTENGKQNLVKIGIILNQVIITIFGIILNISL